MLRWTLRRPAVRGALDRMAALGVDRQHLVPAIGGSPPVTPSLVRRTSVRRTTTVTSYSRTGRRLPEEAGISPAPTKSNRSAYRRELERGAIWAAKQVGEPRLR
jgi:hypothetical protein